MKRVFISAVSLQPRNGLQTVTYEPYGFQLPKGNIETSFPLIPVVKNYMARTEDAKIILIRDQATVEKDTCHKFVEQLLSLGIIEENISILEIDSIPDKKGCRKMLWKLLDIIDDDSIIYADVTYGKKPVSSMMLYALNLVEKIKDTEVEGIFYGDISWKAPGEADSKAVLVNITDFKYMTDIANELSNMDYQNLYSVLKNLEDIDE